MRIVFFGASELGYACCERLLEQGRQVVGIFTAPREFKISYSKDKPVRNVLYADFGVIARKYGLPLITMTGKMGDYREELKKLAPDFLLVIGWYHMVPKSLRDLAAKGCAGIHASLLPKYRGGAPLVWAIINGEKETGVTLFYLEDGVDSGDIVAQEKFAIEEKDTIREVLAKAKEASLKLVEKYVPLITQGEAPRIKQDESRAIYVPQRKPEDGLIDWNWDAKKIKNFIRAQTKPYPGAFTVINGKKVTIWDADIYEQ